VNFSNKLAVVIVNYNVKYFLEQALLTVHKASEGLSVQVIVVDNNSVDGSLAMIKDKFPEVVLIANKENVGFSKANNQGILSSDAEYVLMLNPDTVIQEDTLAKCITFMDQHANAGAVGVKMIDGKGHFLPESKRGLPTPEVAFYKLFGFSKLFPKSKIFGKYHLSYLDENATHEVEILSGAFMFMRREALDKSGLLDETFFMYGEDVDLSYRITKSGYKNYYFSDTSIIHYKGESTKKSSVKYIFTFYQAMMIFADKHFSGKKAKALANIINLGIYLKISYELVKQRMQLLFPFILDFILIWVLMYPVSVFWGFYIKETPVAFDLRYYFGVLPVYCGTWIFITYFSGGYDKPFSVSKVFRGLTVATLFISATTNFFSDLRYSRGLILVGAFLAFWIIVFTRYLLYYLKNKSFDINQKNPKNALLLGSYIECVRVGEIVKKSNASVKVLGYLNEFDAKSKEMPFLGSYSQFEEVIAVYDIDEVLFCSKDLKSKDIISYMVKSKDAKVDFKIIPNETDYIIGSSSKNSQGNIYTIDILFNILQEDQIRNKRLIDLVFVFGLFLLSPIFVLFQKNKAGFLRNLFWVFWGVKSWVGVSRESNVKLGKVKDGVLQCVSEADPFAYQKEIDYAKNYNIYRDIDIISENLTNLGS
jgi:GT2 family glycosyltransferase